jgi:hypothetical protein
MCVWVSVGVCVYVCVGVCGCPWVMWSCMYVGCHHSVAHYFLRVTQELPVRRPLYISCDPLLACTCACVCVCVCICVCMYVHVFSIPPQVVLLVLRRTQRAFCSMVPQSMAASGAGVTSAATGGMPKDRCGVNSSSATRNQQ